MAMLLRTALAALLSYVFIVGIVVPGFTPKDWMGAILLWLFVILAIGVLLFTPRD